MPFPAHRRLIGLLCVLILLAIATYINRYPSIDDAWIAEQVYWLEKEGIIRSELFRGVFNWEKQLFVSHKLHLLIGAGITHWVGFQYPGVLWGGLLFFTLLVLLIGRYIARQERTFFSTYFISILILVFANRFLIRTSFEFRPELAVTVFGFGSFLALTQLRQTPLWTALAGLLAGLAMLCHLNGVVFLMAGALLLLFQRQFTHFLLFSTVGSLTALCYFIDVVLAADGFSRWLYQFQNDPATQGTFGLSYKLKVMLTYPRLFFYTPEHAALSILFVFVLWHQRAYWQTVPKPLRQYFILLVISFWLVNRYPTGMYLTQFIPFMLLISYELYKAKPFVNRAAYMVLALYFIIGLYGIMEFIILNTKREPLPVAYQKLRPYLNKKSTGLVPMTFFFNEFDYYEHLLCHENFTFSAKNPAAEWASWANSRDVDFILMDYSYRPEWYYPAQGTKRLSNYELTYTDSRFALYTRR